MNNIRKLERQTQWGVKYSSQLINRRNKIHTTFNVLEYGKYVCACLVLSTYGGN